MVNVEATGRTVAMRFAGAATRHDASAPVVNVTAASDSAFGQYANFCAQAVHGPAQHPVWVRAWNDTTAADVLLVTVERSGRTAFALALEVVATGPFRIAQMPGGRHANGNFVAVARDAGGPMTQAEGKALRDAIRRARPDIDLVVIERQNPTQEGLENPLSDFATARSPNVSLSVNLEGGFDATLERVGAKRKLKKYRLHLRKFETMGGYRLVRAGTPDEIRRIIDEFFAIKAERLRKAGIADSFGAPEIQAFFRRLFLDALATQPRPYELHALEVGGAIRAINGCSVTANSVVCEFGGIRDDEPGTSPGFFLEYECVREACEEGKTVYDFSVGDEPYKRSWCDTETWQFDTMMPMNLKGRLLLAGKLVRGRLVHRIKSSDRLWSLVKRLRAATTRHAT